VSLHCGDENARSKRVAERCGFLLEGCTRQDHRAPDGHLENSLHYGLLRTDLSV
jgi:RimJ/RimL family protein N-acetyltransferase